MLIQIVFILLTLLVLCFFYFGTGKNKKVLFISLGWLLLTGVVSSTGFFEDTRAMPPRFLLVIFPAIIWIIYMYRQIDVSKIRTNYLLAVHIARVPVEIILYALYLRKEVPVLMTFKGWNFDIIIGTAAFLLLLYIWVSGKKPARKFFIAWNSTGIIFLLIIVTIAILSAPLPLQQLAFDQPNVAVIKFPFVFLPGFIVPAVFLSHLLLIRSGSNRLKP